MEKRFGVRPEGMNEGDYAIDMLKLFDAIEYRLGDQRWWTERGLKDEDEVPTSTAKRVLIPDFRTKNETSD